MFTFGSLQIVSILMCLPAGLYLAYIRTCASTVSKSSKDSIPFIRNMQFIGLACLLLLSFTIPFHLKEAMRPERYATERTIPVLSTTSALAALFFAILSERVNCEGDCFLRTLTQDHGAKECERGTGNGHSGLHQDRKGDNYSESEGNSDDEDNIEQDKERTDTMINGYDSDEDKDERDDPASSNSSSSSLHLRRRHGKSVARSDNEEGTKLTIGLGQKGNQRHTKESDDETMNRILDGLAGLVDEIAMSKPS